MDRFARKIASVCRFRCRLHQKSRIKKRREYELNLLNYRSIFLLQWENFSVFPPTTFTFFSGEVNKSLGMEFFINFMMFVHNLTFNFLVIIMSHLMEFCRKKSPFLPHHHSQRKSDKVFPLAKFNLLSCR